MMSGHAPSTSGNGPPSAGMGMHHGQGAPAASNNSLSQQNLNQIVIEYLVKKGYHKTEQMLRNESSRTDSTGRPISDPMEDDLGSKKYGVAYELINGYVEQNLDVYKFELNRLIWPMFVYSYIELIRLGDINEAKNFFQKFSPPLERIHLSELQQLGLMNNVQHLKENPVAKLYLPPNRQPNEKKPYNLPLNANVYYNLVAFVESKARAGGNVIAQLLAEHCNVVTTSRGPLDQYSFEAIIKNAQGIGTEEVDLREGIPGAFEGVTNSDLRGNNSAPLKLGFMPMEPDLEQDVRGDLADEDALNPPPPGKRSLFDEFEATIKKEDGVEAPNRAEIPFPPSRARDVTMEIQKVKEHRDRFRIDSRTGGVGVGVSVCMFTFHNTLDCVTCIEFSDDQKLIAVGTEESYIRVWSVDGEPLPSLMKSNSNPPTSSRRLIGHSATVYGVSFSPSIDASNPQPGAETNPRLLVSSSSDGTIRLWSLETWTCLVVYKGHAGPVWDIRWGPFGHYFASCGRDMTVRVWGQDHASALRLMVGHDSSVNKIAWHPNGAYVFSCSDTVDNTVRMWSFVTGECVRVFTGHTHWISALECAPNGKIIASADVDGSIILFDIAKGTMIKRCRGHGKGGIWSLSFSVESTALVSGGADGTVRVWDVEVPSDPHKTLDGDIIASGGQTDATRISGANAAGPSGAVATTGGKKKGKDMTITPDQISAFPTKKTPVYKVKFTRMNLVVAGGCYQPTPGN